MVTEQVCTDCGALFGTQEALSQHRTETSHSTEVFKCDKCAEEFSSQGDLETHLVESHKAETDPPIR